MLSYDVESEEDSGAGRGLKFWVLIALIFLSTVSVVGCTQPLDNQEDGGEFRQGSGGEDPDVNPSEEEVADEPKVVNPHPDVEEEMDRRRTREAARLSGAGLDPELTFSYVPPEKGIGFYHNSTPDSGKEYKPNHYDHGNSVSVADVDGDGRLDVYFTNQLGPNELWINEGDGGFGNATTSELAMADKVSSGASFADVNNDGEPDLYVTSIRGGNELFVNEGGRLVPFTEEAGVGYRGHSSSAVFFDYNLDGHLDLFVVNVGDFTTDERHEAGYYVGEGGEGGFGSFDNHENPSKSETSILYENQGDGTFVDVTEEVGLEDPAWSGDATPVYFRGSLHPGLYLLNMQGDDSYYVHRDGSYVEATADTFGETPWGAMGVKSFDHDKDGDMDVYITDMHSDMHPEMVGDLPLEEQRNRLPSENRSFYTDHEDNVFGNAFYVQETDGFSQEVQKLGAEIYWPWGVSVGDLDADGYQDVFVTASMNYGFKYVPSHLLLNDEGRGFYHAEFTTGVEPRPGGRTSKPWFALDCSGDDEGHMHCVGREGQVVVEAPLGSRSSAIFDSDGDGRLDIVTNEFNSRARYLRNDLPDEDVNYLKVDLVGYESNRDGLGARVEVETSASRYVRYYDGQSGYLAQSSKPLYFGLGESQTVDLVRVEWPSGKVTEHEVDDLNTVVELHEEG